MKPPNGQGSEFATKSDVFGAYSKNLGRLLVLWVVLLVALIIVTVVLDRQSRNVNLDSWNRCQDRVSNYNATQRFYSEMIRIYSQPETSGKTDNIRPQLAEEYRQQAAALQKPNCGDRP